MGTLKDIASLFVKIEEEPTGSTPSSPEPPTPSPVTPVPAPPLLTAASAPAGGANDAKLAEKLNQALEENNLQGIDFFEFRKTLEALTTVIADEPTRYRAAFGSLVAQGAKGEHLVATADHYLQVLEAKQTSFTQYLQDQERERVTGKLTEAEQFQKQIREKSEQIARLTQDIGKLTESELAARNEAALAKAELESYRGSFVAIKARFVADIQAIREKINQYVLATPKA